jgi:phosphoglycerate dehydrogenase-like enzyme
MPLKAKKSSKPHILVITPVRHIKGVAELLESIGQVTYKDNPTQKEVVRSLAGIHAIFTNPNKSNVFLGKEVLDAGQDLRVLCTASTGTVHIDKAYAAKKKISVLSLTTDMDVIGRISSTAELAFGLTLASLRHIPSAFQSVRRDEWDYLPFIGRQMDHLTVGVVGYGRLGKFYARYAQAFGSRVLVHDPYVKVTERDITQVKKIDPLLREADVIALHVHVTPETRGMVNKRWFAKMKKDVVLVNTARGEVMNEKDLLTFLKKNKAARLATDVLADEQMGKKKSPLIRYAKRAENIIITPHIGGMTQEGQFIAYSHAANKLRKFFKQNKSIV